MPFRRFLAIVGVFVAIAALAVLLAGPVDAQQPTAPQPAIAYGPPQPVFWTPARTLLWRASQPRAYYRPAYLIVPAAPAPMYPGAHVPR